MSSDSKYPQDRQQTAELREHVKRMLTLLSYHRSHHLGNPRGRPYLSDSSLRSTSSANDAARRSQGAHPHS
jgi:hypothetical protein